MEVLLRDWAGLLLIPISFWVVAAFRIVRRDLLTLATAWLMIAAHHCVSLANVYWGPLGYEMDAERFHYEALQLTDPGWGFAFGAELYVRTLSHIYHLVGPSQLFGQGLTVLAFGLSVVVLLHLILFLEVWRHRIPILLLFGMLPMMLIVGSFLLREAYQILFFMTALYCSLRYHTERRVGWLLATGLAVIGMALLHKGLTLYAAVAFPVMVFWRFSSSERSWFRVSRRRLIGGVVVVAVLAATISSYIAGLIPNLGALSSVVEGDPLAYMERYRLGLMRHEGRVSYVVPIDLSSPWGLVKSVALMFLYYMAMPFPWQIQSGLDVYAFAEVLLRLSLLGFALFAWYHASGVQKRVQGLLLVLYFGMTLLWALGTSNFGTGIRHHLVSNWLLFIVGVPPAMDLLERIARQTLRGYSSPLSAGAIAASASGARSESPR